MRRNEPDKRGRLLLFVNRVEPRMPADSIVTARSIDWNLCISHKEPPHFTSDDEVIRIVRCFDGLDELNKR